MKVAGIVFDCDGVLFESRRANLAYYNAILEPLGEPPVSEEDRERAHICHTRASEQVFDVLLSPEKKERAMAQAAALDYRDFIPYMDPEPGLVPSLAHLSRTFPLGIGTNRNTSMVPILEHFGLDGFFTTVVTSGDVPRPKPFPDMLFLAAERLGLAPEEMLFVGDSELDWQAARDAGCPFVGYKWAPPTGWQVGRFEELVSLVGKD